MTRNPDVDVKMIFLSDDRRRDVIRTVLASGKPIDSFALTNGESAEFLNAGQAVPIIPEAFGKDSVEQIVKMWVPHAFEACGGYWDGRYYGIPFELSNYVAWVNGKDMKAAGLDPERDLPRTWDQFVEIGRRLVRTRGGVTIRNGFMCNTKDSVFNFLVLLAMMEQLGLDWGTEKGFIASMEKPSVLARGLQTYTDFVTSSRIWDPAVFDEDRQGFGDDMTAMFLSGGTWYWGTLKNFPLRSSDVRPFPYPRFPDGKDIGGVGYGYCLFVSVRAKNPKLSFKLLDAMASKPNEFIRYGYYQPRLALSDGRKALDESLAEEFIPYYNEVFKRELAKTAVWLHSTRSNEVADLVWQAVTRVIYQSVAVDDSVSRLQKDVKALFL